MIVPARNESGNIKAIFERIPQMGRETELIFVEGHSKDDTYAAIEREIAAHLDMLHTFTQPAPAPDRHRQSGRGAAGLLQSQRAMC